MTMMCILFAIMLLPLIIALMCGAACINEAVKEIHKLGNTLDDISWAMRSKHDRDEEPAANGQHQNRRWTNE